MIIFIRIIINLKIKFILLDQESIHENNLLQNDQYTNYELNQNSAGLNIQEDCGSNRKNQIYHSDQNAGIYKKRLNYEL